LECSEIEDVDDLSFPAPFSYAYDCTYRVPGLLVRKVTLMVQYLEIPRRKSVLFGGRRSLLDAFSSLSLTDSTDVHRLYRELCTLGSIVAFLIPVYCKTWLKVDELTNRSKFFTEPEI
jgi:hypothetical protein